MANQANDGTPKVTVMAFLVQFGAALRYVFVTGAMSLETRGGGASPAPK